MRQSDELANVKIQKQTSSQLILAGVPGSLTWMLALTFFGLLIMTVTCTMGWYIWQETELKIIFLPLTIGALMGCGFLWVGIMQLKSSEQLILDKNNRTGVYTSTSPIVVTEKSCRFQWKDIESIELSRQRPSLTGDPSKGHQTEPSQLSQAVLKTKRPRRSIILDETQNGNFGRIEELPQATAAFLEMELKDKRR